MTTAASRWASRLESWAIPRAILDAAPESPWGFPPGLFEPRDLHAAGDPSHVRAGEALPVSGTILDVGVGAGAASLPLAGGASHITGVDSSPDMLAAFAAAADRAGVAHSELLGSWPEIAPRAPAADVVTCWHVFYNVADLVPFVRALTAHARRRVVAELSDRHPQSSLNHLWRHFHGIERPSGPTARDALAVLAEAGIAAHMESTSRPHAYKRTRPDIVAFVRRRLCLEAARDPEIDELLGDDPEIGVSDVATLWWDV